MKLTLGLWIGRAGTLEYLDDITKRYMKATTNEEKEKLTQLAREFKENATDEETIKSATYYVRIFVSIAKNHFHSKCIKLQRITITAKDRKYCQENVKNHIMCLNRG